MKPLSLLTLLLFAAGIALIAGSVIAGESQFGLLLIFPFVVSKGLMGAAGGVLIFLAFVSLVFGFWRSAAPGEITAPASQPQRESGTKKRYGGVVLIGPVPIIFGSDEKMSKVMLAVAIAILAAFVLFFLILSVLKGTA